MKKLLYALIAVTVLFTACKKNENKIDENVDTTIQNPTEISGNYTLEGGDVWGVWKEDANITINGSIAIPSGKTLTIEKGVKVMFAASTVKQEVLVYGNLHCKGTAAKQVKFTVPDNLIPTGVDFPRLWGGILFDQGAKELLLLYTQIEYAGAVTTEESKSVKLGFYKALAGEGLPAINFRNTDGKVVIMNCTFNNLGEDGLYMEGGNYIISNNKFYTIGETGGDAINLKSGSIADICFNQVYSPNNNAFKLSNVGDKTPQCNPICYNNTIVNCGWRRATVKGGGVWLEAGVVAHVYNTLHVNCRFGIKTNLPDPATVYDYNYYYGFDQTCVDQFHAPTPGVVVGAHDVSGALAGSNDPLFANYPLNNSMTNPTFNTGWDFHLSPGSPAVGTGTTAFSQHFSATGITIDGVMYNSPLPSTTIGAW